MKPSLNKKSTPDYQYKVPEDTQLYCIDLPGETVECYVHKPKLKVLLREWRDVIFDIKLEANKQYKVYATQSDFYNARDKKIVLRDKKQIATFKDGERFHLWISRSFKGDLVLMDNDTELGRYTPNTLDKRRYDNHPETKPEPMLVTLHKQENQAMSAGQCTPDDPYGLGIMNLAVKQHATPAIDLIKPFGMVQDYNPFLDHVPEKHEYVVATIAQPDELQPHVREQLDKGKAVQGTPEQIFGEVKEGSDLANALYGWVQNFIDESDPYSQSWINSSSFKETMGYIQTQNKHFNKLGMRIYIEKAPKGAYKVVLKGRTVTQMLASSASASKAKITKTPMGKESLQWLGGDFERRGRTTKGHFKRLMIKLGENAKEGAKLQIIGTMIDIYFDITKVYNSKDGSKDFSEFLGRAGVSVAKAALTAVIGGLLATWAISGAAATASLLATTGMIATAAIPVAVAVLIVVGVYIFTAWIVDQLDAGLNVKETVAKYAK